ncbi:MAG: class I SAM-dependent methyltransferase [Methanotrichaceae archaeon]|nr:class I SAM-dependent methyltransferase [Methanotrichaceae archaeon]
MCYLIKGLSSVRDRFYQDVADEASTELQQGNILDVGTGRGLLPIKIAQKSERLKAYGIDISKRAIDAARRDALASGLANAPQFEVGDVCALPFEDEFFDLVVSTFSLHHWPDATAGLNEISRVLKPGGEAWIYDHWKDPSPEARERLRKDFGRLAAWFALAHLRFVSSPLTLEMARSILQDPKLKFQKRRVEERGIIFLMRLQKPEASGYI